MNRYEYEQFAKQNPSTLYGTSFNKFACFFRAFTCPQIEEIIDIEDCISRTHRNLTVMLTNGMEQRITVHF